LVIIVDVPVETALSRIPEKDHFESKKYLEKVRELFIEMSSREGFVRVDGTLPKEQTHKQVEERVHPLLD
jgi:thymidylate kinase